ncbi:PstA family ABC transporter permease [Planctomicrobium piriforme]|uniref:Phosphate transport system permease protein n=1 Tax=Planctomicrobium piriforme TaxID=1576369 RepID=A0A1I3LX16_9PLAN|nr:PstA family ABC transporter permease [Planctomicrobium piriforme]SFI89321.1 phosphate transport system permease protein [Planctomicrobium piriforme]
MTEPIQNSPEVAAAPAVPAPATNVSLTKGKKENRLFEWTCRGAVWFSVAILLVLLVSVTKNAVGWLDWQFLSSFDSARFPQKAGILAGVLGTGWVIGLTILFAVPIGVGAAVYLEEYAANNWLNRIIRVNLSNLAGVPSIVYGILGLTVFVRMFGLFGPHGYIHKWTGWTIEGFFWSEHFGQYLIPLPFGRVVLSGALTLTLLILPVIIIASQEALRAIPPTLRHASLALGATRWQTIRHQVLPAAVPGIMTGVILAISRAIGETAPLVMLGAMTFVYFAPGNLDSLSDLSSHPEGLIKAPFDTFTVMPIQIFNWVRQSKEEFKYVAAAGIVVLLAILLVLNGLAILIRNRYSKHLRW